MTLNEFIAEFSSLDNSTGNFAKKILDDERFPAEQSERQMLDYLDFESRKEGVNSTFQRFLAEFRKKNNKTLKIVLNFLKENNIQSLNDANEKGIAMGYVEACGYIVTIPLGNDYPSSISKDMDQLGEMNMQWVDISNGEQVQSFLFDGPNLGDGIPLRFCCQEIQFNFLLSLID
ncbi:YozE family protein [Chryseobacterium fluminis]|uniref:YozE family protein n=1 Tax=Chryseobacterium fluminis TaxID=2983606 RepID=UPI0022552DE1|nr:YozE family protein [Chryseobacterium sp. MMS21-Ot14]UZT98011.1 YozE family protein [Chryseobacterium sp. MMS21-Ot14]